MICMRKLVTIETLKESQPTRPRKWIPVVAFIGFLLCVFSGLGYMAILYPDVPIFASIIALIPNLVTTISGVQYSLLFLLQILFVPAGIFGLCLILMIFAGRICSFRRAFWWLGAFMVIALIAQPLFVVFWSLYNFAPAMAGIFANIPAQVRDILLQVYGYLNFGMPFLFAVFWFFCLFYNVVHPMKYEEIYSLRTARLKACRNTDERIAYKQRFYDDYRKGNWISMMLELHFESLDPKSTKPMRQDAFEFLVYYANVCDANINEAILNEYAREGRYLECRTIFHDAVHKSEAISKGAKIVLPHYVEPKPKKKPYSGKPLKSEVPKTVEPPLKPAAYKRPADAKVKTWGPDDI